MVNLFYVRSGLESQQNKGYLSLIREYERNSDFGNLPFIKEGQIIQTVDFIIAPKPGLYTASDLNEFVITLSSSLTKAISQKDFSENGGHLEFGGLTFIEDWVAEEWNKYKRVIRLNDKELVKNQKRKKIILKEDHQVGLSREMNVRVFPDRRIAEVYQEMDSMPLAELEKYQQMNEIERTIKAPNTIGRFVYKP